MANRITRHIPNTVTCLNLFSGCVACVLALQGNYEGALLCMVLSAVFDFFDGMLARLLDAHSVIGKDIDSLADDISFGMAPATVLFSFLKEMHYPACLDMLQPFLPYAAFLIAVFSALRLAKFNNDTRQTTSFIGLPVPANALFWGALVVGGREWLLAEWCNPLYLVALICLSSYLLVSEIPMFSLKFKNLSWADNKLPFTFLLVCIPLLLWGGISGLAAIIVWYIFLSVLVWIRA